MDSTHAGGTRDLISTFCLGTQTFRQNFEVGKRVKERPTLVRTRMDLSMHTDELRIVESKVMSAKADFCVFVRMRVRVSEREIYK
jgi:hypothetical protein